MNELYNSNDEMNDFTKHFVECYTLNDKKNPDQIKEEDYKKLNDLLQRVIDNKEKETYNSISKNFNKVVNSIRKALVLTK